MPCPFGQGIFQRSKHMNYKKKFAALLLAVLTLSCAACSNSETDPKTTDSASSEIENLDIGSGLEITSVGSYAGLYVEDGSDETVSDVFYIRVKNTGESDLQYAHISLTRGEESYEFDISTLPVGETLQALELTRQAMPENTAELNASVTLYAAFDEPLSMHEDIFEVTTSDNTVNIKNNSDSTFSQVYVYYKNSSGDTLIGGITYRAGVQNLAPGQTISCYTSHYSEGSSRLLFVTYAS